MYILEVKIVITFLRDSGKDVFGTNFLMELECLIIADRRKQIKRKVNGQESFATVMGSDSTAICGPSAFVKNNPY